MDYEPRGTRRCCARDWLHASECIYLRNGFPRGDRFRRFSICATVSRAARVLFPLAMLSARHDLKSRTCSRESAPRTYFGAKHGVIFHRASNLLVGLLQMLHPVRRTRLPSDAVIVFDARVREWRGPDGVIARPANAPASTPMYLFNETIRSAIIDGAPLIHQDDLTTFRGPVRYTWNPAIHSVPLGSLTRAMNNAYPRRTAIYRQGCADAIALALRGPARAQETRVTNPHVCGHGRLGGFVAENIGGIRGPCGICTVSAMCLRVCCPRAIPMKQPRMPVNEDSDYWHQHNIYDVDPAKSLAATTIESHFAGLMSAPTRHVTCKHAWAANQELRAVVTKLLRVETPAMILMDYLGRDLYTMMMRPLSDHTCVRHPSFLDFLDRHATQEPKLTAVHHLWVELSLLPPVLSAIVGEYLGEIVYHKLRAVKPADHLPEIRPFTNQTVWTLVNEYLSTKPIEKLPPRNIPRASRAQWVAHYHGVLTPWCLRHSALVESVAEVGRVLRRSVILANVSLSRPNPAYDREHHAMRHRDRRLKWVLLFEIERARPGPCVKEAMLLAREEDYEPWTAPLTPILTQAVYHSTFSHKTSVTNNSTWRCMVEFHDGFAVSNWVSHSLPGSCGTDSGPLLPEEWTIPEGETPMCGPSCVVDSYNAIEPWVQHVGSSRKQTKRPHSPRHFNTYDPEQTETEDE